MRAHWHVHRRTCGWGAAKRALRDLGVDVPTNGREVIRLLRLYCACTNYTICCRCACARLYSTLPLCLRARREVSQEVSAMPMRSCGGAR